MSRPLLVLLPGLDGTGELFSPLLNVIGGKLRTQVISYTVDQRLSYDGLVELVEQQLDGEQEMVLVAESFSGPIAVHLAAKLPGRVLAIVLCASFISSPLPSWLRWLIVSVPFRFAPPDFAVRWLMVGKDASDALVTAVKQAIRKVRPPVLAHRLREVLGMDCVNALRQVAAPILYLRAKQDALVSSRHAAAIAKLRPDARIQGLPGPHLLLQKEPLAAWTEIVEFLRDSRLLEEGKDQ